MASALILFPLYMYHLSVEAYGALSIYLVFIGLVQILITFSFDSSVYVHFHEYKNDPQKLANFVSSAFVFMLITGVVVTVLLAAAGELIFHLVLPNNDISFFPYGLACVGTGVFLSIFRVHSSLMQTREKPDVYLWSNVMVLSLIVVFTILGLQRYPHSLAGPIYGRMLGALLPCIWVLWRIFREYGIRFDFHWLKSSFGFNAYAFIYQLQQWFINQFDRVILLLYLTLADVGVYDVALKCLLPIELLMNSLHSAFFPRVVGAIADKRLDEFDINRYYHGLVAVVMLMVVSAILFVPVGIEWFAGKPEYLPALNYIPLLAVAYLFRAIRLFFAFPYSAMKYTKPLPLIYFLVVVVKLLIIILLAKQIGLYAAVAGTLVSAAFEVWLLAFFARTRYAYRTNVKKLLILPVLLALTVLLTEIFVTVTWRIELHISYFVLCLAMLGWTYRREVVLLVNGIRAR